MPLVRHSVALVLGLMILSSALASAAPIDSNITITGSVSYDTGFSFVDNAAHSGAISATTGGTTTTTTYSSGSASGDNPLEATVTDTGDGFGITGTATGSGATDDAEFGIGVDLVMTITNSSLTGVYEVTVGISFSNEVDSAGTDSYVDSEFTLDQRAAGDPPPGTEVFFTDLLTDTVYGNQVGGNPVSGFGGPLSETGSDTLVLTLNPGESYILAGDWTIEGGAYENATSTASVDDFNVQIVIEDVQFIPEPSTIALAAFGLLGLGLVGRIRKR